MTFQREYEYAQRAETPAALQFRQLAALYQRAADGPTLGMLRAAAEDVRREMSQ